LTKHFLVSINGPFKMASSHGDNDYDNDDDDDDAIYAKFQIGDVVLIVTL